MKFKLRFLRSFFLCITLITLSALPALGQTAWTDSGTVNNSELYSKTVSFHGKISSTDTLTSEVFTLDDVQDVFIIPKYMTNGTVGKAKIKVLRQASWFPNLWTTQKTVALADSITTQSFVQDTVKGSPAGNRFLFIGASGNGTNSQFHVKIKAKRP